MIVYTLSHGRKKGKSTLIKLITEIKCQLWREMNTFPSISPFIDRVFSSSRLKTVRVQSIRKRHQSACSPAHTKNNNQPKQKVREIFHSRKLLIKAPNIRVQLLML